MWKVSQIYLSDFRAGSNYMDDGLIKVLDDNGESRDCLIFSPNGTFKTSLLSIALSQLSPSKDRFIQTLQSSSKKIEDYVIRQRPALVMTKFVAPSGQESLFGEMDGDSLVVGQLFFLRPSSASNLKEELERLFFISRDSSVFERVRNLFLSLRAERAGWEQLKKEITTFAEVEDVQRNWLSMLDSAGLDPFLVDKQVEMCKQEGGIANTLEFKDEKAFMSFFLNTTMDIERSSNLHANVLRGMDKHRNIPQRMKELKAANQLKEILISFEQTASTWRLLELERQAFTAQIGEAAYMLSTALPMAEKAKQKATEMADEVDAQRREAKTNQQIAVADKALIRQEDMRRQGEDLKRDKLNYEQQSQEARTEQVALKGGELLSIVGEKQQSLKTTEQALKAASEELEPMRLHLNGTQAAYHSRLSLEKAALQEIKIGKQEELKKTSQSKANAISQLNSAREELSNLLQREVRHTSNIEQAERSRRALVLQNEESPVEGQARLQLELQQYDEHIEALIERRRLDKSQVDKLETEIGFERTHRDYSQLAADNISKWLDEEQAARELVLANERLTVIAGVVDFNPYTRELASAVGDALTRQEVRTDLARSHVLKVKAEIEQLESSKTLSEDPLTSSLLEYYIAEGISDSKLRSFSEYLDSRFDGDIDAIASLMSAEPARFGGLMAVDQETLDQVAKLEAPDWLVRPVIVSLGDSLDSDKNPHLVIEPKDLTVYSPRALARKKEELSEELEKARTSEKEARKSLKELHNAEESRAQLLQRFLGHEHIEAQSQEKLTLLKDVTTREHNLKRYTEELKEKRVAINGSETKERELRELKSATAFKLSQVTSWLEEYAELEKWREGLGEIATKILVNGQNTKVLEKELLLLEERILTLTRDIQACTSQLESLMDNAQVPPPSDGTLLPEAPSSSLHVLQQAYYEADRALNQAATENGIGTLEEKLRTVRRELGSATLAWESYKDERLPDMNRVEHWLTVADLERSRAKEELDNQLINLGTFTNLLVNKLASNAQELEESIERLRNHCNKKKVRPSLDAEGLREENLKVLMEQARDRHARAESEFDRLGERASTLRCEINGVQEWHKQLTLASARIGEQATLAPQGGGSLDWPLLTVGQLHERVVASTKFDEMVKEIQQQLNLAEKHFDKARRQLNSGFDKVKRQIENKAIADMLFDLVQRLLNTDAGTFANQTADFIESCDSVIRNLKMDIAAMDRHVVGLVNSLLDHASDCYQVLTAASNASVPESVLLYGGHKILQVKARLDFVKYGEAYQEAMRNWFFEVVEKKDLPQANAKKGDELGATLLYRLLSCTGKRTRAGFDIGLLKMAGQPGEYVPISEDLSSGGERLTSATMLYSVISHVRSRQRQHIADGNSVGFLFMDNPLSKASKASFVQAQLHTCQAFGIQPIFVTGVGDIAALEQFSNRIVITKADGRDGRARSLKINGEVLSRVVISEELLTKEIA